MKLAAATLLAFSMLALAPVPAAAQAALEYGLGTAITGAGRGARATGNAIDSINRKLARSLESATPTAPAKPATNARTKKSARASASTAKAAAPAPPPPPAVVYEDPAGIREGMEYGEVVRRFGPTTMITSGPGKQLLIYTTKDRTFEVQVDDGKVASISKAG